MHHYPWAVFRARARTSLRIWFATYRSYRRVYHPFVDLGIRLSLAQAFFHSGMVKIMDWPTALYLARYEYPVSWLSPEHAALLGVAIELVCPILLALGFLTRAAALPMALLALVIQVEYLSLDTNLLWAALLFSYVVFGAKALSLDALITPGLATSALPLVKPAIRAAAALTERIGPWFQLLLRLWLAWALLRLPGPTQLFPIETIRGLVPLPISGPAGMMLGFGLGATVVNKLLVALVFGTQMMSANAQDGFWLALLLAQVGVIGAGRWSFDNWIYFALLRWVDPALDTDAVEAWPRVVIVGAGVGGMACAARLRHLPVHLTLVDRHNYHLFQPLLYQVASAALSPADIASPIRSQFRDDLNVHVRMAQVTGIDTSGRVVLAGNQRIPYDTLVVATGASHCYFGKDEWAPFAPGLKQVEDATSIRARLLAAFEHAENSKNPVERNALLTFVIVGAGPTGVELAGAIAEMARFGLQQEFRGIDPADARIILVQAGNRILPTFHRTLSGRAQASLESLGVDVRLNSRVQEIDGRGVIVAGERLASATVLWAAGVTASPAARWLGLEADRSGRVPVNARLNVSGHDDIFVIGDTAASQAWDGKPVPGLVAAARQGGTYVAKVIRARLEMRPEPPPFQYRHWGSLATIGRQSAIADFGRWRMWGAPAWWLWGLVHVLFLAGLQNRVSVVISWIWAYLTFRSSSRLITGLAQADDEEIPSAAGHPYPASR